MECPSRMHGSCALSLSTVIVLDAHMRGQHDAGHATTETSPSGVPRCVGMRGGAAANPDRSRVDPTARYSTRRHEEGYHYSHEEGY
jgi:hypothetical protein